MTFARRLARLNHLLTHVNSVDVVFCGTSIMRHWNYHKALAEQTQLSTINTGISGMLTDELFDNLDSLVLRFKPKLVVLYCGDNDLEAGRPYSEVASQVNTIISMFNCPTIYLTPKPSPRRERFVLEQLLLGALVKPTTKIWLNKFPIDKTIAIDGLHLTETGTKLLTEMVKPTIEKWAWKLKGVDFGST